MGGPLKPSALWVRVDQNRLKVSVFVVGFVTGSALLLVLALIVVPGSLLSLVFADEPAAWFEGLGLVAAVSFIALLAVGGLASAVQLANAEDWVRSRFKGRDLSADEAPGLLSAVQDMQIAAGLGSLPRIIVIDAPGDSVNALALGTSRANALIGVTPGFLSTLSEAEMRAVVAALVARITAGDIMFGTALAALMGPLKAIRESRKATGDAAGAIGSGCADSGCSNPGCSDVGCGGGCLDGLGDSDGCAGAVGVVLFIFLVVAITYDAVVTAAWIVTLWGRALSRTAYEKADAEGMLLVKDPGPTLSAMAKAARSSNAVANGDESYDGIFYAATSGTARVERVERRRYDRLREVVGTDGLAAPPLGD